MDRVELVYTRFVSAGSQEVVQRPLIPLERELVRPGGQAAPSQRRGRPPTTSTSRHPTAILDTLVPRYVEARIYAALLNAAASEQAFRQRAMKAATDNADELIKTLSRVMNRGPPGLHHHRDHGDRRRGGGAGRDKRGDDSPGFILELLDPQGV